MQRLANPASFLLLVLIISIIGAALILNNGIFYLGLGIMAWGLAIFFKVILGIFVHSLLLRIKRARAASLIWGFWSAGCELLFAALFLWKFELISTLSVIAFGLGAGLCELAIAAGSIAIQDKNSKETESEVKEITGEYWRVFYERFFSTIGQVGSRLLIWLGLMHSEISPVAVAVLAFGSVETLNAYLKETSKNLGTGKNCLRYQHLNAASAIIQISCCVFFLKY